MAISLEEIDAMLAIELNDSLLPVASDTSAMAIPPRLADSILSHHLVDHHIEQLFDRPPNIRLSRLRVDLECVVIVPSSPVNTLLGNERTHNHLVRLKRQPELVRILGNWFLFVLSHRSVFKRSVVKFLPVPNFTRSPKLRL